VIAVRLAVAEQQACKHSAACEQKRLEERVASASKTESVATLAGSLAHDFNNLLAAILGNTELALLDALPQSPVRYCLDQIDKTSRRAAELAHQMLTYTGRGSNGSEFSGVNLNELVQEMAELLRISIPKSCAIKYYFSRPLPLICGEASQLRQVVMNLLINAGEAMGGRGGTIHVRTGTIEEDGLPQEVTLEVRDTGSGMTPEIRARIFDPFFTTKKSGRGLGLAAVQGIVRAHQGTIEVESQPGKGSTFRIVFPVYRGAEHAPGRAHEMEVDWHGTGNVLLVDDDDAVREAAQRLLKKAGYTVLEARSGSAGIEAMRKFGGVIHAAVLDINMPGMDGYAVYEAIRALRPDIQVLMWSGLEPEGVRARLKELGDDLQVIEKPSHMRDIAVALKRLLAPPESEQKSVA
jgi:nitrogen-specific signal transduction histidine kinase/ActR/RegA family two-component response regulator